MDYNYETYDSALTGLVGGTTILLVFLMILLFAFAVVEIIALWKLFKKAGKKGWESIVPFYGYYVLAEIAGLNWWWFLLAVADSIISLFDVEALSSIADLVSLFASFNIYYNIAKRFGKDKGNAVCAGIFSTIFVLIFGFSKKETYNVNIPVSKNGIFGPVESMNNAQPHPTSNVTSNETVVQNNVVNENNKAVIQNNVASENNETIVQDTVASENSNVAAEEVSFCGNCGTKLNKNVKFCPNCGKENL